MNYFDVIIIGGGQSGLAMAYYLRRLNISYTILDAQEEPGGAWLKGWESLKLFSPAAHSSLPGWMMPQGREEYPGKKDVIAYLKAYEERYDFPVIRPVFVESVVRKENHFKLSTTKGEYHSKVIVSSSGTWGKPYIPVYPGMDAYEGVQIHAANYNNPSQFSGQKVAIIGGGNSAAQILAEVSKVADVKWITLKNPRFLPDEVDGRYLFEFATKQYQARLEGRSIAPPGGLGDVVMVDSVKEARSRGVLDSVRPFEKAFSKGLVWEDGQKEEVDAIIWCTGFKPALDYLQELQIVGENGKVQVQGTRAVHEEGLWLVGYGNWTGFASATLIGVGRTARQTAREIQNYLGV